MMSLKPKVALSQDFLANLSKLPSVAQGKVLKWAIRFQTDPQSSSINYENIHAARDKNLKSVRIDQDWRGIVFKPSQGDVYVLLYVDHHDAAYQWAENRRIAINPVTGAMQVVLVEEIVERVVVSVAEPSVTKLFDRLTDRELLSLGTPEELLPRIRIIRDESELDALQERLPVEAYEGLFLCAAGDSVSQILSARETRVDQIIDTQDFAKSLERAESQSRFVVVENDEALTAIMNAPLAQWRIFLHPTQKKLATADLSGPARVLGGAGTGKTVLAMHRAKWLAENKSESGKKILFTTFTRNLAIDVEENLKTLCGQTTMARVEVRNLDAWVHGFLRSHRYEHTIVYGRQGEAGEAWQNALAIKDATLQLPEGFYESELEQVVLAQGITTRDEYRLARRAGRGVVLTRGKRDAIWPVFEEYRSQLSIRKLKEVDDAYRDAATLLVQKAQYGYSSIIIDETQDFGPQALKLLRAMIPVGRNDLFFVGDGHQRIYSRNKAALSRSGIDIRGRARKLYINYRTTDEIRRHALAFLEGCEIDDLDEGIDESTRYKSLSHGSQPFVDECGNLEEVMQALSRRLAEMKESSEINNLTTCVITHSKQLRDQAQNTCKKANWKTGVIEANQAHAATADTLWFSTMHRAKGLEFDQVVILADGRMLGDIAETAEQRRLLYVALTRAKRYAGVILY